MKVTGYIDHDNRYGSNVIRFKNTIHTISDRIKIDDELWKMFEEFGAVSLTSMDEYVNL